MGFKLVFKGLIFSHLKCTRARAHTHTHTTQYVVHGNVTEMVFQTNSGIQVNK